MSYSTGSVDSDGSRVRVTHARQDYLAAAHCDVSVRRIVYMLHCMGREAHVCGISYVNPVYSFFWEVGKKHNITVYV